MQDVFGVVGRPGARPEHQVVASALTLTLQPPQCQPCEGIEPVQGTGKHGDKPRKAVLALDVGQLVQEDGPKTLG